MKVAALAGAILLAASVAKASATINAHESCATAVRVQRASEVAIRFDIKAAPVKRIDASYFGFNLEWVGFQADLWDANTGTVHPDIAHWLQRMRGAIYRYPGGTVANYFQWRSAIGSDRQPQKAVDWSGPIRMSFGPAEYFRFVQTVGGHAWLVANMQGEFSRELPAETMAEEASDFAEAAGKLSAKAGVPIVRWELGNELDRPPSRWTAEKYAANANLMAAAIRKRDKGARFVALWPDYDAFPGVNASEYAKRLSHLLKPYIGEFAQHMYFDGPPGGPPVTNRLLHMCKLINSAKEEGKTPSVWVTEFARWPPGKANDPNWKLGFPLTANLSSAISTADFLIGTTQVKQIRGGMIHSLSSSKGPWPMFHRHGGRFNPSAVFLSLVLLRQGLVGDVLPTFVISSYDTTSDNPHVRAVAVINPQRNAIRLTMINRAETVTKVRVDGIPLAVASRLQIVDVDGIHDDNKLANNFAVGDRLVLRSFDRGIVQTQPGNNLKVSLPPNSIVTIMFGISGPIPND